LGQRAGRAEDLVWGSGCRRGGSGGGGGGRGRGGGREGARVRAVRGGRCGRAGPGVQLADAEAVDGRGANRVSRGVGPAALREEGNDLEIEREGDVAECEDFREDEVENGLDELACDEAIASGDGAG